jgi:hypothetical protein
MPWTQADADAVRAAIVKLASGSRVAQVSYAGPPARSVSYHDVDLAELRRLLAEMEQAASITTSSYRLAVTRKGLGQ